MKKALSIISNVLNIIICVLAIVLLIKSMTVGGE